MDIRLTVILAGSGWWVHRYVGNRRLIEVGREFTHVLRVDIRSDHRFHVPYRMIVPGESLEIYQRRRFQHARWIPVATADQIGEKLSMLDIKLTYFVSALTRMAPYAIVAFLGISIFGSIQVENFHLNTPAGTAIEPYIR